MWNDMKCIADTCNSSRKTLCGRDIMLEYTLVSIDHAFYIIEEFGLKEDICDNCVNRILKTFGCE